MSDQRMTADEREAFLAELHVGVLGIERPDGPPLVVPVWYSYEPGGDVEILTSGSSLKGRLADAAGRASLCAQQEELPYRYVTVEGPVEIDALDDDELTRAAVEAMAIRYLGESRGKAYAAQGAAADEIRIRLRPQRWFSVDYAKSSG